MSLVTILAIAVSAVAGYFLWPALYGGIVIGTRITHGLSRRLFKHPQIAELFGTLGGAIFGLAACSALIGTSVVVGHFVPRSVGPAFWFFIPLIGGVTVFKTLRWKRYMG